MSSNHKGWPTPTINGYKHICNVDTQDRCDACLELWPCPESRAEAERINFIRPSKELAVHWQFFGCPSSTDGHIYASSQALCCSACGESRKIIDEVKKVKQAKKKNSNSYKLSANIRRYLKLIERDGPNCFYCKVLMITEPQTPEEQYARITIDHVLPLSQSGANNKYNMVLACRFCNQLKSDREIIELLADPVFQLRFRKVNNK